MNSPRYRGWQNSIFTLVFISWVTFSWKLGLGRGWGYHNLGRLFLLSHLCIFIKQIRDEGTYYGSSAENENCSLSAGSLQERAAEKESLYTWHFLNASTVLAIRTPVFTDASPQSCIASMSRLIPQRGMRQARKIQQVQGHSVDDSTWIQAKIWAKAHALALALCCLPGLIPKVTGTLVKCWSPVSWVLTSLVSSFAQ